MMELWREWSLLLQLSLSAWIRHTMSGALKLYTYIYRLTWIPPTTNIHSLLFYFFFPFAFCFIRRHRRRKCLCLRVMAKWSVIYVLTLFIVIIVALDVGTFTNSQLYCNSMAGVKDCAIERIIICTNTIHL